MPLSLTFDHRVVDGAEAAGLVIPESRSPIGADVVGMSVVPEVLVAVHAGMKVLGLAIVTDMCLPDALKPANIEDIIRVANAAEKTMTGIVEKVIPQI